MALDDSGSCKTGYRKPPIASQFKPGQSGNPRGRPKVLQKPQTISEFLQENVPMTSANGKTNVKRHRALMIAAFSGAMRGDKTLMKEFLKHCEIVSEGESKAITIIFDEGDKDL